MYKYIRVILVLMFLFSYSVEANAEEESLCILETKKDNPQKVILEKECEKLAREFEKNEKYGFASWYYILAYKNDYNTEHFAELPKIAMNIAHSYLLLGDFDKAKELYARFLNTYIVPIADQSMHEDYKLLYKLYPDKKENLDKGMAFWNEIYKPLLPVNELDIEYKKAKKENRYADEIIYLTKIITLQKKYQNKDNIHIDNKMIWLAAAYYHNQEYKKALTVLHEIRNKKITGVYHLYFLYYMANSYVGAKEYENAFLYYEKILDIEENGKNDKLISKVYKELGELYGLIEKNREAMKYLDRALAMQIKIKMEDASTAAIYNHIGDLLRVRGDELEAYSYYEKSLDISKRILGKNNIATADRYSRAGILYSQMGDNERSLEYFKKALAIRERLRLNDASIATNYSDIGVLYDVMKNYEEAYLYHEKSLSIRKEILGENHPDTATSYNNLGSVYQDEENYSTALEYYEKSLRTRKEVLGEEHLDTATSYNNIGGVYHQKGDYSKALDQYRRSLNIRKNLLGEKHRVTATSYNNISTLYADKQDHLQAYYYADQSFDIFIENRNKNFRILSNKQKKFYLEANKYVVSLLLKTAYLYKEHNASKEKIINVSQQMINSWLSHKGSIFDSENVIATLYGNTQDKDLKVKIDSLIVNKRILAKLYQSLPKQKERKQWKKNIKQTEEKIGTLTNEISKKAQSFKESQGLKSIDFKDIVKNLKENELYIDYAKTEKNYYVFSLDNKEEIHFSQIDEKSSQKIDDLVKIFRKDVIHILNDNNLTDDKLKKLTTESKEKLIQLYDLVLAKPLSKVLKDKTNLIFSPDGALRLLPFEAMYDKSNNKYLIEEKEIRYIPSGKELIRLYKYSKNISKNNVSNNTVIFSNPNFNASIDKVDQGKPEETITPNTSRAGIIKSLFRMRFAPLPGTKEEAESIKQTLHAKEVIEYTEGEATEYNLMNVKNPNILHIATHGFFINDNTIPNPMLKSGIALSGANKSVIKGKSDGVVTALKLSGLKLKETDLVVLSACQTGVVDINSTDSVSGLSKAFIQAGAKDIVMSLWSVNDQATKDLMSSFYQEMQRHLSYAKALKEAKLKMIEKDMHPFYWAPFIVNGL